MFPRSGAQMLIIPVDSGAIVGAGTTQNRRLVVEVVLILIFVAMLTYVCFWSVKNDEIYNARKQKERVAFGGDQDFPEN